MDLISRNINAMVAEALQFSPVVVISGARQVGKSTLMHQLLEGRDNVASRNLDRAVDRESAREDPDGFIEQYPQGTLSIDEVQRVPDLLLSIKYAIDKKRSPGRFILTGSADLLSAKGSQESLAGRAQTIRLYGLSQGEIEGKRDDFANLLWDLPSQAAQLTAEKYSRRDYLSRIVRSGYPEIYNTPDKVRNRWFDAYLERVLSKDLHEVLRIQNLDRLHPLLSMVAAENASEFVNKRYSEALDLPARSLPTYLKALEDVFLVTRIPAWGHNISARAVSKPKVMVTDPGLAAYLNGVDLDGMEYDISSTIVGGMVEGFVVSELLKQQGWSQIDYKLYHWRDSASGDAEVDIVLENRRRDICAVEVKATVSIGAKHFKGLKKLRDKAGERFISGVVLHAGTEVVPFGDRLWALPIAKLWNN